MLEKGESADLFVGAGSVTERQNHLSGDWSKKPGDQPVGKDWLSLNFVCWSRGTNKTHHSQLLELRKHSVALLKQTVLA